MCTSTRPFVPRGSQGVNGRLSGRECREEGLLLFSFFVLLICCLFCLLFFYGLRLFIYASDFVPFTFFRRRPCFSSTKERAIATACLPCGERWVSIRLPVPGQRREPRRGGRDLPLPPPRPAHRPVAFSCLTHVTASVPRVLVSFLDETRFVCGGGVGENQNSSAVKNTMSC